MTRLARKVNIAKWRGLESASESNIPADAVSVDLRTTGNTLSFWRVDPSDPQGEINAILAIVGTLTSVDKIDVVFVDESDLAGVKQNTTPGKTAATQFSALHVDLMELNIDAICTTASAIARKVFNSESRRLLRKEVLTLLTQGVSNGLIEASELHESVRTELSKVNRQNQLTP